MRIRKLAVTHGWTAESLETLEKQTKDMRQRERISAVRLLMQGYSVKETAKILSRTRQTVSAYIHTFEQAGMEKLLSRGASPGKPSRLSPEEQARLKETILNETPKSIKLGLESSWHTRNIQAYIKKEFHVHLGREAIRLLLHRLELRYTRPTYQLKRADASQQAAFKQELNLVKKISWTNQTGPSCIWTKPISVTSSFYILLGSREAGKPE